MPIHTVDHKYDFQRGDVPQFIKHTTGPTCAIFSTDDNGLTIRLHADDLDAWIENLVRLRHMAEAMAGEAKP
jgi:hypothetical protein